MVSPGDKMPFCAGVGADNQFYSFDSQAGRAAILVLGAALDPAAVNPLLVALSAQAARISALRADLLLLLALGAASRIAQFDSAIPAVLCPDLFFTQCAAPPDTPFLVVIDRAARVVAAWPVRDPDPAPASEAALQALTDIGWEQGIDEILPAPVLAIPGLFDRALCRDLIEGFEAGRSFDSGISGVNPQGQPADGVNHAKKRRRDWLLQPGDDIYATVMQLLFRRCVPEIKRAFQSDVAYADRILIARYDDSGGYFRRHRDNLGASVAFRQFALSVNLNGGYDGGHLEFPEFNDHRYRPPPGGGIVFSSSLLHEATPVTRGRRYVLLTFLHDAAAEARRLAARPATAGCAP